VNLAPFYVAEVPVTWGHWIQVMGDTDLPGHARNDVPRFLRAHGEEAATRIGFNRWREFCRRLTDSMRGAAQIGSDWEFTPPTAVEFEYLLKGGLSEADDNPLFQLPGNGALNQKGLADLVKQRYEAWRAVEYNLDVLRNRQHPVSVWHRDLLPNRLKIRLGLVATWTSDGDKGGRQTIAGPSFWTRPNQPKRVDWDKAWPEPWELGLPNYRRFILHDLKGYWPWIKTSYSAAIPSQDQVGLYLVLRESSGRHKQAVHDLAKAPPVRVSSTR
jgi:hypothetical protein